MSQEVKQLKATIRELNLQLRSVSNGGDAAAGAAAANGAGGGRSRRADATAAAASAAAASASNGTSAAALTSGRVAQLHFPYENGVLTITSADIATMAVEDIVSFYTRAMPRVTQLMHGIEAQPHDAALQQTLGDFLHSLVSPARGSWVLNKWNSIAAVPGLCVPKQRLKSPRCLACVPQHRGCVSSVCSCTAKYGTLFIGRWFGR